MNEKNVNETPQTTDGSVALAVNVANGSEMFASKEITSAIVMRYDNGWNIVLHIGDELFYFADTSSFRDSYSGSDKDDYDTMLGLYFEAMTRNQEFTGPVLVLDRDLLQALMDRDGDSFMDLINDARKQGVNKDDFDNENVAALVAKENRAFITVDNYNVLIEWLRAEGIDFCDGAE